MKIKPLQYIQALKKIIELETPPERLRDKQTHNIQNKPSYNLEYLAKCAQLKARAFG